MHRAFSIFLLILAIVVVLAIPFCLRPSPITGVNGADLSSSVNDGGGPGPCERSGETWECTVVEFHSGNTSEADVGTYRVTDLDWLGCWEAERIDKPPREGDGLDDDLSGCITIADHL